MGIDGLSIATLGLHKEQTSAQLANQAEAVALKNDGGKVQDIAGLDKKEEILVKTEDKRGSKKDSKKKNNQKNTSEEEKSGEDLLDLAENDPKNYTIRFNEKSEVIELIDKETNSIIETITAKELMYLVSKVNGVSGILVNRKI